MHNNINNMNTNIETNTHSDNNPAPSARRRPTLGLKVTVVALSLIALALSYRAATEAVALYGVLDKVQDTLAHEQTVKAQVAGRLRNFETIPPVAGL